MDFFLQTIITRIAFGVVLLAVTFSITVIVLLLICSVKIILALACVDMYLNYSVEVGHDIEGGWIHCHMYYLYVK